MPRREKIMTKKNVNFDPTKHQISDEQAQEVKGGKVAPGASLSDVDDKCVCTLSNNSQISGSFCNGAKEGDSVPGHDGVTVSKKSC